MMSLDLSLALAFGIMTIVSFIGSGSGQQTCQCSQNFNACLDNLQNSRQESCLNQCSTSLNNDQTALGCYRSYYNAKRVYSTAKRNCIQGQNADRCTTNAGGIVPPNTGGVLPNAGGVGAICSTNNLPAIGNCIGGQCAAGFVCTARNLCCLPVPPPNRVKRHASRRLGIPALNTFDDCMKSCQRNNGTLTTTTGFFNGGRFKRGSRGGRSSQADFTACAAQNGNCVAQTVPRQQRRTAKQTCRTTLTTDPNPQVANYNRTAISQQFCQCISLTTLAQTANPQLNCATIQFNGGRGGRGRGGRRGGDRRGFFQDERPTDNEDDEDEDDD